MSIRDKLIEGNPSGTHTRAKTADNSIATVWLAQFKMRVLVVSGLMIFLSLSIGRVTSNASPTIISRAAWNARRPTEPPQSLTINPPPFVLIHHGDSDGCTSQAICQARVRSYQNWHMDHNGWDDIGYNFLVGEDGNVYEGRGWGIWGAHSPNYNSKSVGICFIGTFQSRIPQAAAIKAVKDLIEFGVSTGKIARDYTLLGHRQTRATTCPGDKLYELIQTWPQWKEI